MMQRHTARALGWTAGYAARVLGWTAVHAAGVVGLVALPAFGSSCARPAAPAWAASAAVPLVHNDHAAAKEKARRTGALLFIDVWAAWCHPCRVFQRQVLSDVRLRRFAGKIVFSSIDSEDEDNADFVARYSIKMWPTLLVVDPNTDETVAVLYGAPDVTRFVHFLDRALQRHPPRPVFEPTRDAAL